jgi:cation:H+ antiporter
VPSLALDIGQLVLGLALLYFGAEWLVGGAAGLARSYGIRQLIIGLTVVSYGTSAPELVVGVSASLRDQGAIALGNVIGSNVANFGLILAICALIRAPRVDRQIVVREIPVLLLATAAVPLVLLDGRVSITEAAGLLAFAVAYTVWMILTSRRGSSEAAENIAEDAAQATGVEPPRGRRRMAGLTVLGLILLIGGGHLLVTGASGVARVAGLSDQLIGVTIVAIGTSLPELATCAIAAVRGHGDIAVGNVVGSNIFNVLLILGSAGLAGSIRLPIGELVIELVALGAITLLATLAMATRRTVGRVEAIVMLVGYVVFLSLLAIRR